MGLVRALQPWDLLLTYCNKQLRNYIAPLLRTARGGILHPPSDVYIRSFLCPISYFNKTLLHKSSWVIKPGPWSQNYILFFRDHEFDVVHRKLISMYHYKRFPTTINVVLSSLPWDLMSVHTFDTFPSIWGLVLFSKQVSQTKIYDAWKEHT